jgi:hypothetical protein
VSALGRWHEPCVPSRKLGREITAGVVFWVYKADGLLVAMIGIQVVRDVDLIRRIPPYRAVSGTGSPARCSSNCGAETRGACWSAPGLMPTGQSA